MTADGKVTPFFLFRERNSGVSGSCTFVGQRSGRYAFVFAFQSCCALVVVACVLSLFLVQVSREKSRAREVGRWPGAATDQDGARGKANRIRLVWFSCSGSALFFCCFRGAAVSQAGRRFVCLFFAHGGCIRTALLAQMVDACRQDRRDETTATNQRFVFSMFDPAVGSLSAPLRSQGRTAVCSIQCCERLA